MSDLVTRLRELETEVAADVLERPREIHCAINALVSRRHFFMLGSPGTAKSYLVQRIVDRIDFSEEVNAEESYFHWLLTRYTTPEEVFGPPSLPDLQQGHYRRNTARKLPRASVSFLDEIFKANSSILNAMLTIMNERKFHNNGDDSSVPLSTIFSASNEMPADEGLWALWDRLHFRFVVKPIQDSGNFVKMLTIKPEKNPAKLVTWQEILDAQEQVDQVVLPSDVFDAMKMLRDKLREEGIEPTERRFNESLAIIKAEAFLRGRTTAEIDDMRVLRHVLWSREEDQRQVEKIILELANPLDKEAADLLERLTGLEDELRKAVQDADNPKDTSKKSVEIYAKLARMKKAKDDLDRRFKEANRESDDLNELLDRFNGVAEQLLNEGFGVVGRPNLGS